VGDDGAGEAEVVIRLSRVYPSGSSKGAKGGAVPMGYSSR